MNKNRLPFKFLFLCLVAITFCCFYINSQIVAAEVIENENNNNNSETINGNRIVVKKLLNEISNEIKSINSKINLLKEKQEYEKYPAIRLNVDTPFFGISSIINNRYKIKENVSTFDVASGYSVKDVIRNGKIRVPDIKVAGFIVTTREIDTAGDLSLADSNLAIFKLLEYIAKTKAINNNLNNEINNILSGYISDSDKTYRNDIKETILRLNNKIADTNNILNNLKIINNSDIQAEQKRLNEINTILKSSEETSKSLLLTSERLKNLKTSLDNLEIEIITINTKADTIYNNSVENIDVAAVVNSLVSNLNEQLEYVKQYRLIELNKIKKEAEQENIDVKSDSMDPIISVKSLEIETELETYIANIKKILEVEDISEKYNTKEKKEDLVKQLQETYKKFITAKIKFIKNNSEYLIEDVKNKLNLLGESSTISIWEEINYSYIINPTEKEDFYSKFNTSNIYSSDEFIKNYTKQLDSIKVYYISVTRQYENIIKDKK